MTVINGGVKTQLLIQNLIGVCDYVRYGYLLAGNKLLNYARFAFAGERIINVHQITLLSCR